MEELKPGWQIKGIYNEACASEGQCPYYFGRDKEGGCRYFMAFRIQEGTVNDVDLSGITVVYLGDLPHSTYAEVIEKGSEGAIYISDNAIPEQRKVLDILAVNALGGNFMKKVFGVQYVKIEIEEGEDMVYLKMPSGEMKMHLTKSHDGNPVRLENTTMPFLSNVKTAHTSFWNWSDYNRHYDYKNRCGTWANFVMMPMPH
ncbi:MAG: DUF1326 domain-containing protein [Deltaproteobacteria bacterium]|nr:DUF1326 domain-containing protein [Deltaproteobacteria bacterium]